MTVILSAMEITKLQLYVVYVYDFNNSTMALYPVLCQLAKQITTLLRV